MSEKLFHYTPVLNAVLILRDGVIRRSSGKTPPYVWLSSNPTNEPTAVRFRAPDGGNPPMAYGPALLAGARFVLHECEATPWQDLPLTRAVRSWLARLAERKGGQPQEWFALDADVPPLLCRWRSRMRSERGGRLRTTTSSVNTGTTWGGRRPLTVGSSSTMRYGPQSADHPPHRATRPALVLGLGFSAGSRTARRDRLNYLPWWNHGDGKQARFSLISHWRGLLDAFGTSGC
jgi:hypothetical protein